MTKIQVLDASGNKKSEIETKIFDAKIRQDIIQKIVEIEKTYAPHAPFYQAGQQTSASGNVRHLRHAWKSDRGRGMARVPKKKMSRRGERFHWVGAVIPGTVGGRRAHPPKLVKKLGKINKKELMQGLRSALAMIASSELIKKKYSRLKDKDIKVPIIIDAKVLNLKTKDFMKALKKILADASIVGIKQKKIRAGKGTMRNRKYKTSAGALLVVGKDENKKASGIEIVKANEVSVTNLTSNGARIVIFTEAAVKDMEARLK